ncbi:uncharacterized protein Triagg1_4292 [Trichoderma aggressivum f. europaeum]|uniref:Uncharacterized protein n=1 Tax=Trichoderma aggressivum f. europaeum TaxID=173218 RepID=A0AAE1M1G6_9HYPO|nr:hypothetical protein Triagg1_4292 [Trichoderma aggressivum f. europaeum]
MDIRVTSWRVIKRAAPWRAMYFAASHKTFNITKFDIAMDHSPAAMPSIRRYRQIYPTALAAIAASAFETESKAEEVIKVTPATQIGEDKLDKLAGP